MNEQQLSFWEPKNPTVAQYVYRVWLWFYRGGNKPHYYPSYNKVMEQVVEYLELPEDLISRIVRVQSRWEARRILRSTGGIKR